MYKLFFHRIGIIFGQGIQKVLDLIYLFIDPFQMGRIVGGYRCPNPTFHTKDIAVDFPQMIARTQLVQQCVIVMDKSFCISGRIDLNGNQQYCSRYKCQNYKVAKPFTVHYRIT
ncbi:hypothetical protein D3C72_1875910 [compost metagenome]